MTTPVRTSPHRTAFLLTTLPLDETTSNIDIVMTPAFARRLARLIRAHAPSSIEGGAPLRALGLQIEQCLPAPLPEPPSTTPSIPDPLHP